jgi:hypothetical protein
MKTVLSEIEQIIHPAMLSGSAENLALRIKSFVLNSGLYFEKHLESTLEKLDSRHRPIDFHQLARHPAIRDLMTKDLKPNLLVLNKRLEFLSQETPTHGANLLDSVRTAVKQVLSNIGEQQLAAIEKPSVPENFQVFLHHLLFEELDKDAQLKVYYRKKSRRDENPQFRLSLMVEMDRLGAVRTDFWVAKKNVNITFFAETEEARRKLNEKQDDLGRKLSKMFETATVKVVASRKKIDDFKSKDLTLSNERQVNLMT